MLGISPLQAGFAFNRFPTLRHVWLGIFKLAVTAILAAGFVADAIGRRIVFVAAAHGEVRLAHELAAPVGFFGRRGGLRMRASSIPIR